MAISKQNLETAIAGLEILVRRNENWLKSQRDFEEACRRNPFLNLTFANPALQAKSDREQLEKERELREKLTARKTALKAFNAELRALQETPAKEKPSAIILLTTFSIALFSVPDYLTEPPHYRKGASVLPTDVYVTQSHPAKQRRRTIAQTEKIEFSGNL